MDLTTNAFEFSGLACNVVMKREDKFLMVQEKKEKVYGLWNLPGGRVDKGETLEHAAIREAKEETGFDIKLVRQIMVSHPAVERHVLHSYEAEITGGKLAIPEEELLDAQWLTYEEILKIDSEGKLRAPEYVLPSIEKVRA